MWITYPPTHILLKASLSCKFLKTTKLSSRWLSKDDVQQWHSCSECKQYTSHVTFFSFTARTHNGVRYHIGSSVGARHPIHVSCAWVIVFSLPSSSLYSHPCVSLISSSSAWTLTSTLSCSMWMLPEQHPLCTPPNEESGPLANNGLSHRTHRVALDWLFDRINF